uniref:Uncharacterized protein n=1 Tax=Vitis vinifera TaxID=29760 RepID=F6HG19_VITVI
MTSLKRVRVLCLSHPLYPDYKLSKTGKI